MDNIELALCQLVEMLKDSNSDNQNLRSRLDWLEKENRANSDRAKQYKEDVEKLSKENKELRAKVKEENENDTL